MATTKKPADYHHDLTRKPANDQNPSPTKKTKHDSSSSAAAALQNANPTNPGTVSPAPIFSGTPIYSSEKVKGSPSTSVQDDKTSVDCSSYANIGAQDSCNSTLRSDLASRSADLPISSSEKGGTLTSVQDDKTRVDYSSSGNSTLHNALAQTSAADLPSVAPMLHNTPLVSTNTNAAQNQDNVTNMSTQNVNEQRPRYQEVWESFGNLRPHWRRHPDRTLPIHVPSYLNPRLLTAGHNNIPWIVRVFTPVRPPGNLFLSRPAGHNVHQIPVGYNDYMLWGGYLWLPVTRLYHPEIPQVNGLLLPVQYDPQRRGIRYAPHLPLDNITRSPLEANNMGQLASAQGNIRQYLHPEPNITEQMEPRGGNIPRLPFAVNITYASVPARYNIPQVQQTHNDADARSVLDMAQDEV